MKKGVNEVQALGILVAAAALVAVFSSLALIALAF